MAELAARNTSRETVVADGDLLIHELVGEVISALRHGSDEDTYALARVEVLDVISGAGDLGLETQGDLPAVWRKMVGDGVLDDAQKLLLRVGRSNGEAM